MKKTLGLLIAFTLVAVASSAAVVVGRAYAANPETGAEIAVSADQLISASEIDGLLFMREEEKLARDVYLRLYDQWNLSIFQNIAASESAHKDAILTLLQRYGIEDPAAGNNVGEFSNPDLQALYDQLVVRGEQSLSEALKVSAAIEEIDILDLEERIAQTDMTDIITVYQSLLKGSRNHLRSFTRTLAQQTGETYAPQYLSQEAYDTIVQSGIESGGQSSANQNGNGNGSNGSNGNGNKRAADR